MKKIFLLVLFSYNVFAQSSNVGSLTQTQMVTMAMATPSIIPMGYLTYCSDGVKGYYRWSGTEWIKITDNPELLAVMSTIPINNNQIANGSNYYNAANPPAWSVITSKPTTLAGYGITDGFTTANARSVISLTTTGTGSPTYNNTTGVVNIPNNSNVQPQFYTSSGMVSQQIKVWNGIVTPSTGSGQTVDISSAGFSTILNVQAQVESNTASATSVPLVSIKSYTTTSVVTNIIVSNNSTIGSLLSPIVGLLFATNLTGYKLHVQVTGY